MQSQETHTASTTARDGCRIEYTYRPEDRIVLSVCVLDAIGRMTPATMTDRADAEAHLRGVA